ncbi:hypothetical protein V8G54_012381 [Vigna mungo]|uniref:Cytochrome b561 domain-containing protein n=1 Tax=Vigna mungo TaxID=3915 RepID=A0AAQ3NT09_VIGMU
MATLPVVSFPIFTVVRVVGVAVTVLLLTWAVHFRGGLALVSDNKDLIFNVTIPLHGLLFSFSGDGYAGFAKSFRFSVMGNLILNEKLKRVHPVLMVIGLVLINGEGMLAYKTLSGTKSFKKSVHLTLQFAALILSLIGIWAAWKFHIDKGIDNFYSLHSCGLLGLQHFGTLEGQEIEEQLYCHGMFSLVNKIISRYSNEALLINSLGILIVILGGFVILGLITPVYGKADVIRGNE